MKRRSLPPFNSLKAFEAVARHKSFSLAAEELCVTHSAISQQIKLLEEWVDKKLFIRHSSTISLTRDAEKLSLVCTHFFNNLEECISELTNKSLEVEVVIGASHSFMANWLIPRLEKLEIVYPNIHIKLMTCNDIKLLEKEKVDIFINSISEDKIPPNFLNKYLLFPDRMGPICNHEINQINTVDDILRFPLLHTHSNLSAWNVWFDRSEVNFPQKSNDRYFDSLNLMIEAAVSGLGIAIAPQILVEKEILSGRLTAPFGFMHCDNNFYAIVRKDNKNKDIMSIINWLIAEKC
ncbi:MAG: LysR family transcriptional regulator [Gammaproteobacteria bacterium]|nr:LysR family transcriptional regulator [Gammaproteobacteria bacterium]